MSHSPSSLSNPRLAGRTAIVTGGSRGIGAAIARRLAADGARVAVVYRSNGAKADAVVRAIRGTGAEAIAVQADVSDAASVHTMVDTAQRAFGGIDILVNNAGILASQPAPLLGTSPRSSSVVSANLSDAFRNQKHRFAKTKLIG
nr:SDR family NAD(P)-dependent oxidoreductase [Ralstonia solanacearum]